MYSDIDDIRPLLGNPAISFSGESTETSIDGESMTDGVGTTFYRAPEQEAGPISVANNRKSDKRYTVQADIFSFGVILFELFHPPFVTYMERAETLAILRGDKGHSRSLVATFEDTSKLKAMGNEIKQKTNERFPAIFRSSVPDNAQW
jgi:serine/threonine protein kinase